MAARLIPGIPKSVDFSSLRLGYLAAKRRRRAVVAFATGSVLFIGSATAMISDGASARGPGGLLSTIFAPAETRVDGYSGLGQGRPIYPPGATVVEVPLAPVGKERHRAHARHSRSALAGVAANFSSGRPVCVRLCDGFFFPASEPAGTGDAASEEAACEGLCPDAPVAVFRQPSGSDQIEDALSATGQRYSALPIALRYRSTQDNTCTCHRSFAGPLSPLRDGTLRKGDAVMTPKGILVFSGVEKATHTAKDFSALAAAPLPKDQRTTLRALERVSVAPQRGVTRSWVEAEKGPPPATAPETATATAAATTDAIDKIRFVERPE